jgi:sensor histidine kinase YesM
MSWADSLRFECTYAWLWAAWTPLILRAARRSSKLFLHLPIMILVVSLNRIVFDYITHPPHSMFQDFSWGKAFRSIESNLDTGVLLYAVVVLVEQALVLHARHRSEILKASALQTKLVEAQLQALKMQLHPHFLFNTLHSITALIHEDPDTAELMIARLGELLRLFLATTAVHEVPLSEELRILGLYLEIESARFEQRLQVRYDVPDCLRDATVPSLVLQPLVENSIRHGTGRRSEPGWISIAAERDGDRLVLCVTDNGEGLKEEPKGHQGAGLAITRGRLATLYGPKQSLLLRNVGEGGVEARITLPFRIHSDADTADQTHSETYYEKDHVELQSAHS